MFCSQCLVVLLTYLRACSGDGNCGFRAFLVGIITSAFKSSKSKKLLLQSIPKTLHSMERWDFLKGGRRGNIQQGASQLMVRAMPSSELHSPTIKHVKQGFSAAVEPLPDAGREGELCFDLRPHLKYNPCHLIVTIFHAMSGSALAG